MINNYILKITKNSPELILSYGLSLASGVNMEIGKLKKAIDDEELIKRIENNKNLILMLEHIIGKNYNYFLKRGYFFLLCDGEGYIIKILCDAQLSDYFREINLVEGVSLRLEDAGTNAISLAMQYKKQVEIVGEYHYCKLFKNWYCTASPIINYKKCEIIGYLDMSCIGDCEIKEQSLILRDIVNSVSKRFGYVDKGCVEIRSRFDFFDVKILSLLIKGDERKSICYELNISESTLRRRISKVCNILNAKNEMMAIAKAVELGLIDSDGNIL